ncbi:MAG: hypothetical protein NWF04_08915 [Candidatus Bathyarchaeota archaeon]|nr:hypothetical protein [Candidatus Bathyarchaeota archaeon]
MEQFRRKKFWLICFLLLLCLGVALGVASIYPVSSAQLQTRTLIDDTFNLTALETYRQGLGSFHGNENLTLHVSKPDAFPVNFSLITYGGSQYSAVLNSSLDYSFCAGADYYEAVFTSGNTSFTTLHLQVLATNPATTYPLSWLGGFAKALFFVGLAATLTLLMLPYLRKSTFPKTPRSLLPALDNKGRRRLQVFVVASLVFWLLLLAANSHPLATFEDWYTDSARHPYSANLFTKVGFSIFDTSLGGLSSMDDSYFKFVTWPEMPHLYPVGSVFLFLPFGALLENGASQALVFKLVMAVLLLFAHVCLYMFLKQFSRLDVEFVLKAVGVYLFYVVLVVYAANGMFEAVPLLFLLLGLGMFLQERYDVFLLLVAVAVTFKYQAGIFLFPLVFVGLVGLLHKNALSSILRSKVLWAAAGLIVVDLFTAYLSAHFLLSARPELVLNGVNAFSPHAQIPWMLQAFAVLLFLAATTATALYLSNQNRLASLLVLFSLVPSLTMPYFQSWYLCFFFVYPLLPMQKRALQATLLWVAFAVVVLAFGGVAFNPLYLLDNIRHVLNL